MYKRGLDFVCLQETHAAKADYYTYAFEAPQGRQEFLVILSGAEEPMGEGLVLVLLFLHGLVT